jgi:tetratricopeptide (TPR) repeat protein
LDIFDLMERLENKSLVIREDSGPGPPRFRMLESVHQYLLERLDESGEAARVTAAHAAFFLALAEEAEPSLRGPSEKEWLERLEREHGNLRAALGRTDDGEAMARFVVSLHRFWLVRGHLAEGRGWLEAALSSGPLRTDALAAKCSNAAGILCWAQGDFETARSHFEQALDRARSSGDEAALAGYLNNLAMVECEIEDYANAKQRYEEALAYYRRVGDRHNTGVVLSNLGVLLMNQRIFDAARVLLREALRIAESGGSPAAVAGCEANMARLALEQGESKAAREHAQACLVTRRELGDIRGQAAINDILALADVAEGKFFDAVKRISSTEALRSTLAMVPSPWRHKEVTSALERCRQNLSSDDYERAWQDGVVSP